MVDTVIETNDALSQEYRPKNWLGKRKFMNFDRVQLFPDRIELTKGILGRDRQTVYLDQITNIRTKRSLIGNRITVWLDTAGQGTWELKLGSYPAGLAESLQEQIRLRQTLEQVNR